MSKDEFPPPPRTSQWVALILTLIALFVLAALVPPANAQTQPEPLRIGAQAKLQTAAAPGTQ